MLEKFLGDKAYKIYNEMKDERLKNIAIDNIVRNIGKVYKKDLKDMGIEGNIEPLSDQYAKDSTSESEIIKNLKNKKASLLDINFQVNDLINKHNNVCETNAKNIETSSTREQYSRYLTNDTSNQHS
ncbi:MAG: hypothetical protein EOP45_22995 [Sphingobacteriaceae bacterium]|nr:MAG: hypothetical protein EOP45_22995 [Sphingobacteriaceae bacterium]